MSSAVVTTTEPVPTPEAPSSSAVQVPAPASPVVSSADPVTSQPTVVEVKNTPQPTTSAVEPPPPASTPPPPPPTTEEQAPAPSTPVSSAPKPEEPKPEPTPSPAPPVSSAAPSVPVVTTEDNGQLGMGITYDPFTGSSSSSQCKTEQEIASDFNKMKDYKAVRIYGQGCNIIPAAIQNALKNGQKLMAGVYLTHRGNGEDLGQVIQTYKNAIDKYAGGNWDVVQLFSVENERVNDHDYTASEVVDAIHDARDQLRGVGYNGAVGAVETVPATIDNPAICQASDVVMINCHAFFDANSEAKDAGSFVKLQMEQVKSACNNKRVVVTESGWPHQGNANGRAVPSLDNQRIALDSIRANFKGDMFLHNAFDSTWKTDWASSFNAERYWGILQ